MEKIKYQSGSSSPFFKTLDKEVDEMMRATGLAGKAKRLLYIKAVFYILLFVGCYLSSIDNNPFLRLSPQHPLKRYHRFQHLYAVAVYCIPFFIASFSCKHKAKFYMNKEAIMVTPNINSNIVYNSVGLKVNF